MMQKPLPGVPSNPEPISHPARKAPEPNLYAQPPHTHTAPNSLDRDVMFAGSAESSLGASIT